MKGKLKQYLPGITVFLFCNILFFTPGNDLPKVGDWFGEFSFDKVIHTCFFALMNFLFIFPVLKGSFLQKRSIILYITLAFCLWGVAVEFIQQNFIPGRSFSVVDMIADAAGALIAYVFVLLFFRRHLARPGTSEL